VSGSGGRERAGCFAAIRSPCDLAGLWSGAAGPHIAGFGDHLNVRDPHRAIHSASASASAAVSGGSGALAGVTAAILGCAAGTAAAVGAVTAVSRAVAAGGVASHAGIRHGAGNANGMADMGLQVLGGHELNALRRSTLRARLFGGLSAGLAGLRAGLAGLRGCGLSARLSGRRLARCRLAIGH